MTAAPEHHPGELIPPFAYPDSILSQRVVQQVTIGPYAINVVQYNCAVESLAVFDENYQIFAVLQNNVALLQHPREHQAIIELQASSHLLQARYFFFLEYRVTRAPGEYLYTYANHICRFDVQSRAIDRLACSADIDEYYTGDECYNAIDVDSSGSHLLLMISFDGGYTMQVMRGDQEAWVEIDCSDLSGLMLSRFQWGATIQTLRCYDRLEQQYHNLPIDWDRLQVLWRPLSA